MIDAGWSALAVAKLLGAAPTTVRRWTDPEYAERHRVQQSDSAYRRRQASPAFGRRHFRLETRIRRMADLRSAGLAYTDVAKVMQLDFGVELTPEQVAYSLKHDTVPRPLRERATA